MRILLACLIVGVALPCRGVAQGYNDPQGRFSIQTPAGWQAQALGEQGVVLTGGQVSVMISPFAGSGSPRDVVGNLVNQISSQWQNLQEVERQEASIQGQPAAWIVFNGTNPNGKPGTIRLMGVQGNGLMAGIVVSGERASYTAQRRATEAILQSLRLGGGGGEIGMGGQPPSSGGGNPPAYPPSGGGNPPAYPPSGGGNPPAYPSPGGNPPSGGNPPPGYGQAPPAYGQTQGGANLDQLMAQEREDFGVAPTNQLHNGPMHAPTPSSIPGGQVITTKGLVELLQNQQVRAVVLDVLGGPEMIPGAQNATPASQPGSFNDQTQQQFGQFLQQVTQGNLDTPIVLYCLSPHCWMSYNASLRAINLGYKNVLWYRGGIESWKAGGQQVQQRQ